MSGTSAVVTLHLLSWLSLLRAVSGNMTELLTVVASGSLTVTVVTSGTLVSVVALLSRLSLLLTVSGHVTGLVAVVALDLSLTLSSEVSSVSADVSSLSVSVAVVRSSFS